MRRTTRHFRAHLIYLRKPLIEFLPLLAGFILVLVLGSVAFQKYYTEQPLTFARCLYATYCLVFGEHVYPFPDHWVLEVLYLILPPLGMIVILDGIIRFSYHVLRRDETGKEWNRAMAATLHNHVILCGLGKVGLRILQQLLRLGEQVVVLERDPTCPNLAFARKNQVPVIVGTGREEGVFEDMNTAEAKSIILATDDDLANLEMALDARKVHPEIRVVMRMFDQELAAKIRGSFDLDLAFSTSELSAPLFATASMDRTILNSFYVGEQLLVIARLVVRPGSALAGRSLREIRGDRAMFCLSHQRKATPTMFPFSDLQLAVGDEITIQTEPQTLKEIHRMNGEREPY